MTPTGRTLALLRAYGYYPEIVERWLPRVNRRRDFLGFADVVALKPGESLLAIQTTSGSNHAARVAKLLQSLGVVFWLKCGGAAEVWSWSQDAYTGRWDVRREALTFGTPGLTTDRLTPRRRPRRERKGERQRELFQG